jgi:ribokinase
MSKPIVVVGSLNVDLVFRVPELPAAGQTRLAAGFLQTFGGKGANQAVMAARLGADVALLGKVGGDSFGQLYLDRLREEGIDIAGVGVEPHVATGLAAIAVDAGADNCIVVYPGANARLSIDDVRQNVARLRDAPVVLAQLETPLETTREAFRLARAAGVPTLLNPAPAQPLPADLLGLTTLLVPNEHELEQVLARRCATDEEVAAAAQALRAQGPETVIVTLGARGALICGAAPVKLIPAPKVKAVDTTGAGDAFCGSLAVAWAEGRALENAVAFAVKAATLAVTRPGTQMAFPTRGEVEA